jgi:Zn-dependent peptidase ImmA (M78 family)
VRRGFKAEAERIASSVRKKIGLRAAEPLDVVGLAQHAGATVRSAAELTSRAKLEVLEELQPGAFSACTFSFSDQHIIVYNPLNNPGRRNSDIAHEVAHLLLGHELKEVQQLGGLTFFSCDPEEEEEANWLAGCLLLPRSLLLAAARRGLDAHAIAEEFGVSDAMAAFRIRTTGVLKQVQAARGSSQPKS